MTIDMLPNLLDDQQRTVLESLNSPAQIQAFLDNTPYAPEYENRCPLRVLQENRAHCLDGALLAAAVLSQIGYPPLLVNLLPEPDSDDDHVIAIYRQNGYIGAVAKSNCSGLRFREPVYRSLRELVMSYFEDYFNTLGRKTLRAYTPPLNLSGFDKMKWTVNDRAADCIEARLRQSRRYQILGPEMVENLVPVDRRSFEAGFLGADANGLFKPKT